jgi:hypothetical protein
VPCIDYVEADFSELKSSASNATTILCFARNKCDKCEDLRKGPLRELQDEPSLTIVKTKSPKGLGSPSFVTIRARNRGALIGFQTASMLLEAAQRAKAAD